MRILRAILSAGLLAGLLTGCFVPGDDVLDSGAEEVKD